MDRFDIDADYCEEADSGATRRKKRRVKKKKIEIPEYTSINILADIEDVKLIVISHQAQTDIKCVVDTDVTPQKPWKYVSKSVLADHLESQDGMTSEDFEDFRKTIEDYPNPDILLVYKTDEDVEFDQFFVCITVNAERGAFAVIDLINSEIESRLASSVHKTIRLWKTRGSEDEVNLQIEKNNRPLLEIEVESEYPIISAKCLFKLKMVEDCRDGYINILPGRTIYENIIKKRIDACSQATPSLNSNSLQTISTLPQNIWTQYHYQYVPITKFTKDLCQNVTEFINTKLNDFDYSIHINSHFNFYTTDYTDLIKNKEHQFHIKGSLIEEIFSFADFDTCQGKNITNASWHHMWTGTIAIAYSNRSITCYSKGKSTIDEVTDAIFNVNPVLIWCFNDSLSPKLYLETPREISAVSFCPYDENLLVGGCRNGQVIIWDITNQIDRVEKQEILTTQQQNYKVLMNSLIPWMKNTSNLKVVRPVVVSSLFYSHRSNITSIKWISPYHEISRSGQKKDIPEEENRTSLQFLTASIDGSVLTWDLQVVPSDKERTAAGASKQKRSRLKQRPNGLVSDVSPLRALHRILKPLFKVNVMSPGTSKPLPLTSMNLLVWPPTQYIEKNIVPGKKFDITERLYYEARFIKPTTPLNNELIAGSSEGDFLTVSWEGYSFNSGEAVNKELGKIEQFYKFHDGPLVALSRSQLFHELILTVGGKVFALWLLNQLDKPVLWRRCRHKYSSGAWNTYKPDVFRLTRSDGCVERWILHIRSDRYHDLTTVSGGSLGGTYTHPFKLEKYVTSICDHNGTLRLYTLPGFDCNETEEQQTATYNLCKREVSRKIQIQKWQTEWNLKNADIIQLKKEEEEARRLTLKEQEEERRARIQEETIKQQLPEIDRELLTKEDKWRLEEEQRIQSIVVEKKDIDIDALKKLQRPLLKIEKENNDKRLRLKEILHDAHNMFSSAVQRSFPDVVERKPPPPIDPYKDTSTTETKQDLYEKYLEVKNSSMDYIKQHKYDMKFNWLHMIKEGQERRRILDGFYGRPNHKQRLYRERRGE